MKKEFKITYLTTKLGLPENSLRSNIVYQGDDYNIFEIIFKNTDGKFYKTTYIDNNGLINLRQRNGNVICKEVVPKNISITIWEELD